MLQRVISAPILALGAAAEQISAKRDYSIRVKKRTNDEIGFLYDQFNHMLEHIQCGEAELRKARDELEIRVQERTKQLSAANGQLQENIAQREQTAKQIEEMHQQLVDAARQAGMAEIAAGVLHNIGNLLNSVNVSVTVLGERLRESEVKDLQRALEIMQQHRSDLALFITHNDQGKHLPGFLLASGQALESERTELIETVHSLAQHIEHIKAIISTQQSYAGMSGLVQTVRIEELIEDSLQMASGSLQRHAIDVVKEIGDLPQMTLDKHRMLLILVNLITNAKDAVANNSKNKEIRIRACRAERQTVRIEVSDNGEGIAKENLAKIFSHGFTTKTHGHGFGLHSVAIAAKEMSGSIGAASDGLGRGATFTLMLPQSHAVNCDSAFASAPSLDVSGLEASCEVSRHNVEA
jgi:C4-dicarboxylate-specific signal transduction histidine kinase